MNDQLEESMPGPNISDLAVSKQYRVAGIAQSALQEAGIMFADDYINTLFGSRHEHPAIEAGRLAVVNEVAALRQAKV